ncbi:MAG TPA: UDP-N-acetylmuramoyl-L-alanine--D-glutamate ligase [Candidatus Acidoferrales bacterium]|jgi:UDP-N-acetylmuramoylalanine--D-glutamate ligase|nr:UDP-N-acetylmuramoyl-L-alanine--D-glutamate ligase [Candidatus Acidoferrales bacterium]
MRPGFDFQGKRVLVVGLARTGLAVALFSAAYGATVTATDAKPESEIAETAARLRNAGVTLELANPATDFFLNQDLIVVSPGVPATLPALELARANKILVWSEIELAWRFLRGKLVAITGSNGKTTATSLVAHILKTAQIETLVGGNIGVPLLALAEHSTDKSVTVAEISSFQLETIQDFRPEIGVLLNLTPDHLDRHISFEAYAAAKMRMFENQIERDAAVLNADDPEITRRMPAKPHIYWFSRQKRVAEGAFVRDDDIVFRADGSETLLAKRNEIPLRGLHNLENVLAACAASYLAGASPAAIASGVKTFKAVEHRLEFVARVNGVNYYNDSKATNVDATLKAVEAFPGPLFVILGGKDKGSPYTPLSEPLKRRKGQAILIGAAAEKIAADLEDAVPMIHAGTLDAAVTLAAERARPGDTVLLAPACSSFDQFENYEQRGRVFKQLVAQLEEQSAASAAARKG